MRLERADGGRQDLDFDAAVPMYINRPYMVERLAQQVYASSHQNILQDFIFVTHTQVGDPTPAFLLLPCPVRYCSLSAQLPP